MKKTKKGGALSKETKKPAFNKAQRKKSCGDRQPRKAEADLYKTLLFMKANHWYTLYDLTAKYGHSHATVIRWLGRLVKQGYAKKKEEYCKNRKRILYQLTRDGKKFVENRIDDYVFGTLDKNRKI